MEMNPSDAGFQDRYVVQEVIKEMAKNRPIDAKGKRAFKGRCFSPNYIMAMQKLAYFFQNLLTIFHINLQSLSLMKSTSSHEKPSIPFVGQWRSTVHHAG